MPQPTPAQAAHALLMQHLESRGAEAVNLHWRGRSSLVLAGIALAATAILAAAGAAGGGLDITEPAAGLVMLATLPGTVGLLVLLLGSPRRLLLGPTRFRLQFGVNGWLDPAEALAQPGAARLLRIVDEALDRGGAVLVSSLPPAPRGFTLQDRRLHDLAQRVGPHAGGRRRLRGRCGG